MELFVQDSNKDEIIDPRSVLLDKNHEDSCIRMQKPVKLREAIEAEEKQNEWKENLQEIRRQKLHEEWLAKEKAAQEEFENKKKEEERRRQERLDQERRIKEEWEAQQKREQRGKVLKEKAVKEREENLNQELEKSGILRSSNPDDEQPWHNPIATKGGNSTNLYGTERDPNNCSFYLKTGACRFGERCSRQHPRPPVSQTLLIPNMFQDVRLMEVMLDEKDNDVELEFDEDELYSNFKDFYKDVLEEFRSVGQVQQFKVCCNFEPHLRGNVYIQYKSENDALNAYAKFNGRWYAGKQLSLQFSPVNKWKSAICGTFARNRCPRGKNCNFLHVFRNPNNEFKDADRDMWDSPAQSRKNSEREWRSSTRELERYKKQTRAGIDVGIVLKATVPKEADIPVNQVVETIGEEENGPDLDHVNGDERDLVQKKIPLHQAIHMDVRLPKGIIILAQGRRTVDDQDHDRQTGNVKGLILEVRGRGPTAVQIRMVKVLMKGVHQIGKCL
eukprot:gene16677-8119_t